MSKVVVVTGASAGLGRAIVREFAREKALIALIARSEDGLKAAADEVRQAGGKAIYFPIDISDSRAVEDAALATKAAFGPIDIWINNAMVSVFSPAFEMEPKEFERVTAVTYLGYVYGTLAALKQMRPRNCGTIVQVGSALSYRAIPCQSAYCAAKHAIKGFTQSVRCELLHEQSNVRLTMVHMPALNTPQFSWVKSRLPRKPQPVPPIYQPEVGARAVHWAAHHAPRELLVAYPTFKAVLGEKFAPDFADRYLAEHGIEAQMTNMPVDPDRRDNLWAPLPGDWGAHGDFDKRSHNFSPMLWLALHRKQILLASTAMLAVYGAARVVTQLADLNGETT